MRPSRASALLVVMLIAVAACDSSSGTESDTTRAAPESTPTTDEPPTRSVPAPWSGVVRGRSDVVHRMHGEGGNLTWQDPRDDGSAGWTDVARIGFVPRGQLHWGIELAAPPPDAADREPGLLIAYGLVLETTGDGVADYMVGLDNDAPARGELRAWVTDLAGGRTDEQVGPPYGWPVEFHHPDERLPGDPRRPGVAFTFLPGTAPPDLDGRTVRFYAWASAARDGRVVATDYSPDTGWITGESP